MTIRQDMRGAYLNYFEGVPDSELTLQYVFNYFVNNQGYDYNPFRAGTVSYNEYQPMIVNHYNEKKKKKYASIPEVKVVIRPSKRRLSQPVLKPPFETLHDMTLRLSNSMIFVGSEPYQVMEVLQDGKDYTLILTDKNGKTCKAPYYACDAIDLRSPEPQYFLYQSQPAFLRRSQARSQRQGWCYENSSCNYVGQTRTWRADNLLEVMSGLNTEPFPWSSGYNTLMRAQVRSLRLSRDVAVYLDKDRQVKAEFRGRFLGPVEEDTVMMDDWDYSKPWIRQAVESVSMKARST